LESAESIPHCSTDPGQLPSLTARKASFVALSRLSSWQKIIHLKRRRIFRNPRNWKA